MGRDPRYDALAAELLNAPDPLRAIASLIGDHEARLDIALRRLGALESRLVDEALRMDRQVAVNALVESRIGALQQSVGYLAGAS